MGTPPASGSMDQMRRIQVAARGGGEWARDGALGDASEAEGATTTGATTEIATNPRTSCFSSPFWERSCETGLVSFLEVAQQVLFAQHFGLHASWLGAFESMQDAAGSCNGLNDIAKSTANRISIRLRIRFMNSTGIARSRSGGLRRFAMKHAVEHGKDQQRQEC
jgi:hypothetical protein